MENLETPLTSPSAIVAQPDCVVCNHPQRDEIDKALADPRAKLDNIARRFDDLWPAQLKKHLPHLAEGALILAQGPEPADMFRKRIKGRSSVLFQAALKAINNGESLDKAAKLADIACKYDLILAKLIQAPGFAGASGEASIPSINAPGSNFLIQQGSAVQALPAPAPKSKPQPAIREAEE